MRIRTVLAGLGIALMLAVAPAVAQEHVTLFVVSEKTDTVNVYRGAVPDLVFVKTISVGREPHNLGISPDGRWVATSDRRSGEVSVIDTRTLTEAARLKLGRQTHDLAFTPDSSLLYVGHETETFVSVVETGTWVLRTPLQLGRAQHDLSISADGRELWFTVTNRPYRPGDPRVGVVDLATGKVTLLDTGANAHDVTLSPDGATAWVTNSGFTHMPDARVHILDVASRRVLGELTVGKYPFHSPKRGRDGNLVPSAAAEMWFSDHGLRSVVAVSLGERRVVATVPVGVEPYHVAATATGTLFVGQPHIQHGDDRGRRTTGSARDPQGVTAPTRAGRPRRPLKSGRWPAGPSARLGRVGLPPASRQAAWKHGRNFQAGSTADGCCAPTH